MKGLSNALAVLALCSCTASPGTSYQPQSQGASQQADTAPIDATEASQRLFAFIDGLREPEDLAHARLEHAFGMTMTRSGNELHGKRALGQGIWAVSMRPDDESHGVVVRFPREAGADGCALSIGQLVSSLRERGFEVLLSDAIDRPKVWSFPRTTQTGHVLSILAMTTPEAASKEDPAPCVHRVDISMETHDEQAPP